MGRIIRILTTGKPPEFVDQSIVDAIHSGSRVLVKAGKLIANFPQLSSSELSCEEPNRPQKLDNENSVIASWAEKLAQQHGLAWQRVGPDVLFERTTREILHRK